MSKEVFSIKEIRNESHIGVLDGTKNQQLINIYLKCSILCDNKLQKSRNYGIYKCVGIIIPDEDNLDSNNSHIYPEFECLAPDNWSIAMSTIMFPISRLSNKISIFTTFNFYKQKLQLGNKIFHSTISHAFEVPLKIYH